jgi:hypothetical protein
MQARAFAAAPISGRVEAIEEDDWRASNPRQALQRSVRCFCVRAEHDAPDLRRAIAADGPDALLVDINSWGALPPPRPGADRGQQCAQRHGTWTRASWDTPPRAGEHVQ